MLRTDSTPARQPGLHHLTRLRTALDSLETELDRLDQWGRDLAVRLIGRGRLITVGNGGSAAHAEHLAAEMVGRYCHERPPFSSVALNVDGPTLTALANDYGVEEMFARQVQAQARPGDVIVAFSTSGRSPNMVAAARTATQLGATVWSFTGPLPNPLAHASSRAICVPSGHTATVQEIHQVGLHLLCAAFDHYVAASRNTPDDSLQLQMNLDPQGRPAHQ